MNQIRNVVDSEGGGDGDDMSESALRPILDKQNITKIKLQRLKKKSILILFYMKLIALT